ncbi:MAG: type IV pilus twitching motility protein PilT [Candidatus Omnitrophica bacterium]|nr:type IV pilus twitching motility protein PilT [Candidatus Omnitrophota bacterium]
MNAYIEKVLRDMAPKNASDVHITSNDFLRYRIDEVLIKIGDSPVSEKQAEEYIFSLMSETQAEKFRKEKELDFALSIEGVARYRANVFYQRARIGCAIRLIPDKIRSISECGLPEEIVKAFCNKPKGLVLVTGATGSGKSTSLAAMIDYINANRACHIVTVEDPIEYVHANKKALIDQREVLFDTFSFHNALRHVLRQDPNVILIGELRDFESIQQALVIADTGHLVLGTLHTSDAIQTMNRIIDVFPEYQQNQIRTQLSFVLLGIISQQLIPRAGSAGRVLAAEILVATPPVKTMIREERGHQIYSVLQTSKQSGMRTMNQSLAELCYKKIITFEEAVARSTDVEEFKKLVHSMGIISK